MNKIRCCNTIQIGDYSITAVEKTVISGNSNTQGLSITASADPMGIIIESNNARWAIDINGRTVPTDKLMQQDIIDH